MSGIEQEILDLVALQLGARAVKPGDRLIKELGAESADLFNLVATLEDRYEIEIDEEEISQLSTVADVYDLIQRRLQERAG
jgi:acyl carrier protein